MTPLCPSSESASEVMAGAVPGECHSPCQIGYGDLHTAAEKTCKITAFPRFPPPKRKILPGCINFTFFSLVLGRIRRKDAVLQQF